MHLKEEPLKNNLFEESWIETGVQIAEGAEFIISDLMAIYYNLELDKIDPTYLPGPYTVVGTASARKDAIFATAKNLWDINPETWLKKERKWLGESRLISGSSETNGKDKLDDVISAEILVRIIAATKLALKKGDDGVLTQTDIADEALLALNIIIKEVCAKGRTRMKHIDDTSVYSLFRQGGLMIGIGGGKYLPHPTRALPQLLMLLHRSRLRPEVYLS